MFTLMLTLKHYHFKIFSVSNLRIFQYFNIYNIYFNIYNISPKIFPKELSVLSSEKLPIPYFETKKSISFMKMLNNNGPRTHPYGIPQIISHQ